MKHLYELTKEMEEILDADEVNETALEAVFTDIQKKTSAICHFLATAEAEAANCKAEEDRLKRRRQAVESRVKWVKEYLRDNMTRIGADKLKGGTFTISLQNNPPTLVIDDETALPAEYKIVIPATSTPDKDAIKSALKRGAEVPGAHLETGKSVRIR